MTICSFPVQEVAELVDRLMAEGFTFTPLPIDQQTAQELGLMMVLDVYAASWLTTTSPQAPWDEIRQAIDRFTAVHESLAEDPKFTLLTDGETGALLLVIVSGDFSWSTQCWLGVSQKVAKASHNFPRLTTPRAPLVFTVERASPDYIALRSSLREGVVLFDPQTIAARIGIATDIGAIFSVSSSMPRFAAPDASP